MYFAKFPLLLKRLNSFTGRLTRAVVFTVLGTMIIISVFVFLVAASGMLVFSKAHYSDILEKAKGNLALTMSKVEISTDNIIDELCWHLATPELVLSPICPSMVFFHSSWRAC